MSFKTVLVLCAQVFLIQGISAQYVRGPCAWGAPAAEWEIAPAASLSASNGPGVAVTTASPLIPAGVSLLSENAYEGTLAVEGALPFLGTVAFEGALPTAGAGAVAYTCSNGAVGITAENNVPIAAGIAGPFGYGAIGAPLAGAAIAGAPLAGVPLAGSLAAPLTAGWAGPYAAEQIYTATPAALAASNGPALAVSSVSSAIPAGVSVQSENIYEGELAVGGAVPFLGTVALEGALPNVGAGAVAYGCGNGAVGITAEDIGAAGPIGIVRSGWCGGAIY